MFHLECSIHRRCASGLSVAYEQIVAQSEAEAIADADTRFVSLIASRAGSATLRDDAGRIIWSARRVVVTGGGSTMTETEKPQGTSVVPPTIPIRNVNVPDPTGGSEPETKESVEGATGHEAFEKAKAEPEARK